MDVLDYLVRHRDRVVPKTELLDEIWGDRFVSESALSSRIKSARRAIGDNGRDQRLIRTIHGRGFRFVGEVLEVGGHGIPGPPATPGPAPVTPSPHALVSGIVGGLAAGTGRAVAITGSGQACRHLVEDLLHAADDAGIASGRGRGVGELRVFASVAEALDEVVSRRPGVLAAVPDRCRAELEALLGGGPPTAANRVFVAARELVRAAASGGVVIAVEDVHLVDPHTADLLRHLARAARRLPVAVVVTLRAGAGPGEPFETVVLDSAEPVTEHLPADVLSHPAHRCGAGRDRGDRRPRRGHGPRAGRRGARRVAGRGGRAHGADATRPPVRRSGGGPQAGSRGVPRRPHRHLAGGGAGPRRPRRRPRRDRRRPRCRRRAGRGRPVPADRRSGGAGRAAPRRCAPTHRRGRRRRRGHPLRAAGAPGRCARPAGRPGRHPVLPPGPAPRAAGGGPLAGGPHRPGAHAQRRRRRRGRCHGWRGRRPPPRGAPRGRLARLLPGRPRQCGEVARTACATWRSRRVPRPRCST